MNSVIYFLRLSDGLVKIGRTSAFRNRFNSHSRAYGKGAKLLLLLPSTNPVKDERHYHEMFRAYHVKDELFRPGLLSSQEYKSIFTLEGLESEYKFRLKRIWPDFIVG